MKSLHKSILTLLVALACTGTQSQAETIQVFEDTTGSPLKNVMNKSAGKWGTLPVSSKSTAFINFDVKSSGIAPDDVTAARLTIYFPKVKTDGSLSFHVNSSPFSEAIGGSSTPLPGFLAAFNSQPVTTTLSKQFIIVDVTAQVKAWLTPGTSEYGFAISGDGTVSLLIGAKEGPGLGYPAVIEIDVTAGGLMLPTTSSPTLGVITQNGMPLLHTFGSGNFFAGALAGNFTMTGDSNTATGFNAFLFNTTGKANTASGANALYSNTTGEANTATGRSALIDNTTGSFNTATGRSALFSNQTGDFNTATGASALKANTTGTDNTATGGGALLNNTTGIENTATGSSALRDNTTGTTNTATGSAALLLNTTGSQNTASGNFTLRSNTTGNNNTASGVTALFNNTTGSGNSASGNSALFDNTTGSLNTASGINALSGNTTGNNNTAIGTNADVASGNLTNATAIGAGAVVNASNKIRFGNAAVTVIEGQVAFTFTSDRTKKENFEPVDGAEVLRKLSSMEFTSWNYIGQDPKEFRHYGAMAQDFHAAFGQDAVGTIGTSTTVNSGDMAGIMMSAIKELATENAALKQQLADESADRAAMEARLARLEQAASAAVPSPAGLNR